MHSALVTNQNCADTSLHIGLVALITCVLTAVILLLVRFGTKRLRSKSGRGVYKTYFFHLFLILHTHLQIFFRKDRKNIYFQGEMKTVMEPEKELLQTKKVRRPWRFLVILRHRTDLHS